jgi:hypothetical protein
MHPHDGSRANQLSRVEPSAGVAHPLTRWGSPSHELHKSSQFTNSRGEGSRTPHNRLVRLETISNHKLNTTVAPSRLGCWETPKSNQKSHSKSIPQVPLNAKQWSMHLNHSISLKNRNRMQGDEWGEVWGSWPSSKMLTSMSKCQVSSSEQTNTYI